jgi:membrane protein
MEVLHMLLKRFPALLTATFTAWWNDNCLRLGASLAFYTLSSLIPLLLIVLALVTFVLHFTGGGQNLQQELLQRVTRVVHNPDLATQITSGLTSRQADAATKGTLGTVLGVVFLLVTASGVFSELTAAFNLIWKAPPVPSATGGWSFVRAQFLSFTLVLGVAFLLLVSQILTVALTGLHDRLPTGVSWTLLNAAVQGGLITLIFALLFKFLPDAAVAWGDVWLGCLLTALLWLVGQYVLALYFTYFIGFSSYGALGAALAFLFYVYYSSQILFLGGEFTHVYAQTQGSLQARAAAAGRAELSPVAALLAMTAAERHRDAVVARKTRQYALVATAGLVGLLGGVMLSGVGLMVGLARGVSKLRGH